MKAIEPSLVKEQFYRDHRKRVDAGKRRRQGQVQHDDGELGGVASCGTSR